MVNAAATMPSMLNTTAIKAWSKAAVSRRRPRATAPCTCATLRRPLRVLQGAEPNFLCGSKALIVLGLDCINGATPDQHAGH